MAATPPSHVSLPTKTATRITMTYAKGTRMSNVRRFMSIRMHRSRHQGNLPRRCGDVQSLRLHDHVVEAQAERKLGQTCVNGSLGQAGQVRGDGLRRVDPDRLRVA